MTGPATRAARAAVLAEPFRRGWRRLVDRVPVGRLAGFPVYLSPSWLLFAAGLIFGYARVLHHAPGPLAYPLAVALVGSLLGSVLVHELGHALVCRRYGIGVRAVTVELVGGYTEMDRDAPAPRAEAAVSLAGPALSLLLGVLAAALVAVLPRHTVARQLAFQVAASNLLIAAFNLLPGLPLDGGRVLLAAVWAVTGDPYRGSRIAGWVGRGVALVCLVGAVLLATRGGPALIVGAAVAFVAVGVAQGAGEAVRLGRLGAKLPLLDVAALAHPVYRVPAGTGLAEAHRRAAAAGVTGAVLGVAGPAGELVAVVDAAAEAAVPAGRRDTVPVEAVARRLTGPVLPADLRGADLLDAVRGDPTGTYLVATDEDVLGVLRGVDVANLLTSRESTR
jgi:Zn-dependent protease